MICRKCKVDCVIYRSINYSGSKVVVERCPQCRRNPNTGKPFLRLKDYDWDSLPLFEDNSVGSEPCGYEGCENVGVEHHHYAPAHLFPEDSNNWPAGYLCRFHHDLWHEVTETGPYISRRQIVTVGSED